jgi:hypothetical protein
MILSLFDQTCRQAGRWLGQPKRGRKRRTSRNSRRLVTEQLETRTLMTTGTWGTLANLAPSSTGTMLLLSDGTVMAEGGGVTNTWNRLTPSSSGSYANGTWSQLASMNLQRLYFASNMLPDGRVFVEGGEYSGPTGQQNETNTGEIYNPVANTWTNITSFP